MAARLQSQRASVGRVVANGRRAGLPTREPMMAFVWKRLLGTIPSLIGVVVLTFLLSHALPGDPAAYFAGPAANADSIATIRAKLGLDRPPAGAILSITSATCCVAISAAR